MTNFRINPDKPFNNIVTNISSGFNSYVETDPQSINTLATLNYGNKILHDKDTLSGSAREFAYPTVRPHISSSLQNKRLLEIPNRSISAYSPTLNQSRNVRIALAPDAIRQNKFDFSSNAFDFGYPTVKNYGWCGEKLSTVWSNSGGRVGAFAFYSKGADTTGMNLGINHQQPPLQYPYNTRSSFVVGNNNAPNCFCNVINLSGTYVFDWTLEYGLRLKSSSNTFVDTGDMTIRSSPDYFDIKLYSNVNASYIWIRFRPPVRWRYYYRDWTLNEDFSILEDSETEFVKVVNCCGDDAEVPPVPPLLSGLVPTFGATTATADGFVVQIINYNSAYTWAGTATASGTVVIEVLIIDDFLNNTSTTEGYVRVTGVAPGTSSTVTITTTRAGYTVGTANVTETSLVGPTTAFAATVEIPENSFTLTMPYWSEGIYSGTIHWGDGMTSDNEREANHTYAAAGTYSITISGEITGWFTYNNGYGVAGPNGNIREVLISIDAFGGGFDFGTYAAETRYGDLVGHQANGSFFDDCVRLVSIATDIPIGNVTTTYSMFYNCHLFNEPISFDTSNVTNMEVMFAGCYAFNQPLSFDTSNVTNMESMFQNCVAFNQDLSSFDTSNVTNMQAMFAGCYAFNQPLSFDTSNVTNMYGMFYECSAFDQDVSSFDASNVTDMTSMFQGCWVFNQDLSSWCVSLIVSEPAGFADWAIAWVLSQPNWGVTCSADFAYTTSGGQITITGYTGAGGAITIPSTIDDMPVVAIGNSAFSSNSIITSVSIPSSVTSIGDNAFEGCSGLTSVTIPSSVTSIGYSAFGGCSSLSSVSIPSSVTSIGADAFLNSGLTAVTIANGQLGIVSPASGVYFFGAIVTTQLPV